MTDKFAFQKALRGSGLSHAEHHVLITILDYADETGAGAYPSTRTLAADTGASTATVRAATVRLVKLGIVSVSRRRGRSNLYTVNLAWKPTGSVSEPKPGDAAGSVSKPDRFTEQTDTDSLSEHNQISEQIKEQIPPTGATHEPENDGPAEQGRDSWAGPVADVGGTEEDQQQREAEEVADSLLADYRDQRPLPSPFEAGLRKQICTAYVDGFSEELIRRGLRRWALEGEHPNGLPMFIKQAANDHALMTGDY